MAGKNRENKNPTRVYMVQCANGVTIDSGLRVDSLVATHKKSSRSKAYVYLVDEKCHKTLVTDIN